MSGNPSTGPSGSTRRARSGSAGGGEPSGRCRRAARGGRRRRPGRRGPEEQHRLLSCNLKTARGPDPEWHLRHPRYVLAHSTGTAEEKGPALPYPSASCIPRQPSCSPADGFIATSESFFQLTYIYHSFQSSFMDIGTNACSEERAAAGQIPLPSLSVHPAQEAARQHGCAAASSLVRRSHPGCRPPSAVSGALLEQAGQPALLGHN